MTKILWKNRPLSTGNSGYNDGEDDTNITTYDLQANGLLLKEMINQTEDDCLAAVKQNGTAIIYAKHQTDAIKLAAVKQNGNVIQYIKNPDDKLCKAALYQNPNCLQFVKYQTEEMIFIAVKKNPLTVKMIKTPSVDLYFKLIDINIDSHQYMNSIYADATFMLSVWKKILCRDGLKLQNCKKQTFELCEIAIEQNPHAIQFVNYLIFSKIKMFNLIKSATIKKPSIIQYIVDYNKYNIIGKDNYNHILKLALNQNGLLVKYLSDTTYETYELYKLAVEQNKDAIYLIKNKYYKTILNDSSYVKSKKEIEDCAICYSSNEYFIKKFQCNHIYCRDCLQNEAVKKCPMCRESRKEHSFILIKK